MYKQYIPSAFEIALAVLKRHRRRTRQGKRTNVPYLRRPMLKAENQSYRLDRTTGRLRIPIRGTEGVQLTLPLSAWHRSILSDPSWTLGSLTVTPDGRRDVLPTLSAAGDVCRTNAAGDIAETGSGRGEGPALGAFGMIAPWVRGAPAGGAETRGGPGSGHDTPSRPDLSR